MNFINKLEEIKKNINKLKEDRVRCNNKLYTLRKKLKSYL